MRTSSKTHNSACATLLNTLRPFLKPKSRKSGIEASFSTTIVNARRQLHSSMRSAVYMELVLGFLTCAAQDAGVDFNPLAKKRRIIAASSPAPAESVSSLSTPVVSAPTETPIPLALKTTVQTKSADRPAAPPANSSATARAPVKVAPDPRLCRPF